MRGRKGERGGQASPESFHTGTEQRTTKVTGCMRSLYIFPNQPAGLQWLLVAPSTGKPLQTTRSGRPGAAVLSQAVGKIWQQPFDIGQRAVRDVGGWLPRRWAGGGDGGMGV